MFTYLTQLKTVVNFVFEWSHLHLSDKFRFYLGVTQDSRKKFGEMGEDKGQFVVERRVQCCQSETMVAQIAVTEHVD